MTLPAPSHGLSRRHFLATTGLIGVGAVGSQFVGGSPAGASTTASNKASARSVLLTTGVYAGAWDYLSHRSAVVDMGGTSLRTTNAGMTDEAWAAMRDDGMDTHVTISGTDRGRFSSDEAWIADYLAQVDAFLARWPMAWVEIWNEPNFGMWSGATPAQKQAAYGKLLVASYTHIKARWPGVGVIGFGAGGASAAAPGFIRGVLAAVPAASRAFDVCSLHPYFGNTAPEQVRTEAWGSWTIAGQIKSIRAMGVTTPIWFTESGWAISQAAGGQFNPAIAGTVTPDLQAAYRVRMFLLSMKLGIARLNHMYVIDTAGYNGGFFVGSTARPQASALTVQEQLLPSPTALTIASDGPDVYAYKVTTARGQVTVAWSDSGARATVPCTRGSHVVDLYGNVIGSAWSNKRTQTLTSLPTYFVPKSRQCT